MSFNKKFLKILFLILFISFSFPFNISFSKYVIESSSIVARLNIDRCKPSIEFISVQNSNKSYESFANKTHSIKFRFKVIEEQLSINNLSTDTIKVKVNNSIISPTFKYCSLISDDSIEKIYECCLENITENGNLLFYFPAGILEDASGLKSDEKTFDSGITIDNIAPVATFQENSIGNNKSRGTIYSNECIRSINNWNITDDKKSLFRDFNNYLYYPISITDFAGNSSEVFVSIKNATNILLSYGTYDDYKSISLETGGTISGKSTISSSSICKSEALFVRLEGNIDNSLLQARAFVYNYWGAGTTGICLYSENTYTYGYNPGSDSWREFSNNSCIALNNKKSCFLLGGIGLNTPNNSCIYLSKKLPAIIAKQYFYGLSSIAFRLKDYTEYSVVYQIYIDGIGWLETAYNGQETSYSLSKPFSAIRVNIIPKSEMNYLVTYWNRDIGTKNVY